MPILEQIENANDIKKVDPADYEKLAKEIRRFLLEKVSKTGGHLSSNLGAVELTMALHLFLQFPEDKLIWDVGHQSYTHKLLTGRREGFSKLRQYGGMSGFPKRKESLCDVFNTGHSSTSISAALGFAKARDLRGENHRVFAVIGDGALSGGMAYEALNNAAQLKSNMVIILNDNNMSISENVGGMANYLGEIRTALPYQNLKGGVETAIRSIPAVGDRVADRIKRSKDSIKRLVIPGMLFEDMGITYIGPIDGHNIGEMQKAFQNAARLPKAALVHVKTRKGKGYSYAEKNPSKFHGIDPFYIKKGEIRKIQQEESYTSVFGRILTQEAEKNEKLTAVSAAMPSGTGLMDFREQYPERFFDVGIAEEHAVTFAAGMAAAGFHPVVAVYSTFLQRAYDQILHDVAMEGLPVTFAVDRAGLVGSDGETHQGCFDLSYLTSIPKLMVMAPKNAWELEEMLRYSFAVEAPSAVRYPRGTAWRGLAEHKEPIRQGKSEIIAMEEDIVLLAVGSMNETAVGVRQLLKEQGYAASHINVRFVKPMDEELLEELPKKHWLIVTMEENVASGGFGEHIAAYYAMDERVRVQSISLPDQYIEQGSVEVLKEKFSLTAEEICRSILRQME